MPLTEQQWDGWLYWTPFSLHALTATIGEGVNAPGAYQRIVVDSKAMRKIAVEEGFYAALEVTEIGVATMHGFFDSRMLFALP